MEVWLKHPWFVGGQRYRRSENKDDLRTIPDQFKDKVPSTAKVSEAEEVPETLDPADVATRAVNEAAHANDGDSLPGGMDDGGAASIATTALADPAKAEKKLSEGKSEYGQLQDRAKDFGLKYVGVSKDDLKLAVEAAESLKETE